MPHDYEDPEKWEKMLEKNKPQFELLRELLNDKNYETYNCTLTRTVKDIGTKRRKGELWIKCDNYFGKDTSLNIPIFTYKDEIFPRICFHKHTPEGIFIGDCYRFDPILDE